MAEIKQIFDRAQTYLDNLERVGPLGHIASNEVCEEMLEVSAVPEFVLA
jgi:hypothetical protein